MAEVNIITMKCPQCGKYLFRAEGDWESTVQCLCGWPWEMQVLKVPKEKLMEHIERSTTHRE